VLVVFERDVSAFDLSASLDVDRVVLVNQDVGDCRICEQRLEWSKSEEFVLNVVDQPVDNGMASWASTLSARRETSAWTCSGVRLDNFVKSIRLISVRCRRAFISWNEF
jgi:hypothetical protein